MIKESNLESITSCPQSFVTALRETLSVIRGKWRMPIIAVLTFGKKRFKEIERDLPQISPRMLSQELKELETAGIVNRTVRDTTPVTVEYELTASGRRLHKVIESVIEWGLEHKNENTNGD